MRSGDLSKKTRDIWHLNIWHFKYHYARCRRVLLTSRRHSHILVYNMHLGSALFRSKTYLSRLNAHFFYEPEGARGLLIGIRSVHFCLGSDNSCSATSALSCLLLARLVGLCCCFFRYLAHARLKFFTAISRYKKKSAKQCVLSFS